MKKLALVLLLALVLGMVGCKRRSAKDQSLTVEDWTVLPVHEKYTFKTMKRLRSSDTKFENDTEWDQFMHTVLLPAQEKDFPNGLPKK